MVHNEIGAFVLGYVRDSPFPYFSGVVCEFTQGNISKRHLPRRKGSRQLLCVKACLVTPLHLALRIKVVEINKGRQDEGFQVALLSFETSA